MPRQPPTPSTTTPPSWLAGVFANLGAGILNVLLWGLLAVVVVALIVFAVRHLQRGSMPSLERNQKSNVLRSSAMQDLPLPEDLSAAVRELWREGHRREALALLYRGSVQRAAAILRMQPPIDATESDRLQHARAIDDPAQRERLITIVRTWQLAAYADRYPADADVDALLSGWPAQQAMP